MSSIRSARRRSPPSTRTRVFIVDDHPLVRQGVRELLDREQDMDVCGEAGAAPEAVERIGDMEPDAVIVDLSLQSGHGLELIRQIKAAWPAIRVLVLSMHDEKLYAERCLQAGAEAYVHKQEPTDTLVGAIRQVMNGRIYVSGRVADRILHRLAGNVNQGVNAAVESLSDREIQVLELLGRGMSTRDIASHLNLSRKTVYSHRESLKRKLNLKSGAQLLQFSFAYVRDRG